MAQHAHQLHDGLVDATTTLPSDPNNEELGLEGLSGPPIIEQDVDLPEAMFDLSLDPELEEFLDRVMATGILIY